MSHDHSTALVTQDDPHRNPVPNPGIEEHVERWSDVDSAAANRAYRQVVTLFGLVPLFAIAFVVIYFAVPRHATANILGVNWHVHTTLLGLTGGLAVLLIGVGAIHWARQLMNDAEIAEERHPPASTPKARAGFVEKLNAGIADAGVHRRGLLVSSLGGALGILAVPALVTLADLGPWPTAAVRRETIEKTIWADGVRVVNDVNRLPLKPSDIEIGQLVNAEPENPVGPPRQGLHEHEVQDAPWSWSAWTRTRSRSPSPAAWQVGGILAYSKICTHVGCPISLWEQQTHHLLCPCHQSTFDLGNSGVVVFGPAARSLPQLPLKVDAEGYLVAQSDFTVPVGPSYFERDSRNDYKDGDQ